MKKEKISETPNSETATETPAAVQPAEKEKKAAKVTKVGAMLKEMRLQKGLKLSDIAKKLCIRKFYLEAIEDSDYKEVPAFPYGIGFIRSYANFLGLNGENIVELYKEETNLTQSKDMRVLEPQPEASMPGIQYLLISLLAIAVVYAGWTLFNQNEGLSSENETITETAVEPDNEAGVVVVEEFNLEPTAETEAPLEPQNNEQPADENIEKEAQPVEAAVSQEIAEPSAEPAKKEEAPAPKEIPAKGVFIDVLEETWVAVKDDMKLYISKVLQPGSSYKVPEGKGMILSVGKVDGVNVYINGVLTKVVRPGKKTNIALDPFLDAAQ